MSFAVEIHCMQRMNHVHVFGDPLAFPLVAPAGQNVPLYTRNTLSKSNASFAMKSTFKFRHYTSFPLAPTSSQNVNLAHKLSHRKRL